MLGSSLVVEGEQANKKGNKASAIAEQRRNAILVQINMEAPNYKHIDKLAFRTEETA